MQKQCFELLTAQGNLSILTVYRA